MLQSEIIYNIRNLVAGGVISDDEKLSERQYAFIIDYYRAKLFKQESDSGRLNISLYSQDLGKVGLIQADIHGVCDEITHCALRTECKIPNPIGSKRAMGFTHIGLLNGNAFQEVKYSHLNWIDGAKYTSKLTKWYWKDGYIYVIRPKDSLLSFINIQGVFESPSEVEEFKSCQCPLNELDCFTGYDVEYPLPEYQVDVIIKMIAESELRISNALPMDTSNNATDENSNLNER